jgi:hypothetical protein
VVSLVLGEGRPDGGFGHLEIAAEGATDLRGNRAVVTLSESL